MALNEIRYFMLQIELSQIKDTVRRLGISVKDYLHKDLGESSSLDDVLRAFPEGNNRGEFERYFYLQTRVKSPLGMGTQGGRIGISYTPEGISGRLIVSVMDNGENVPEEIISKVYSSLREDITCAGHEILEEGNKNEF